MAPQFRGGATSLRATAELLARMVVEKLPATERAAYVLREAFDY